jgi:hypothetical protein
LTLSTRNLKVFVSMAAALLLAGFASHATAAPGDLSWTAPTSRADGTPLPSSEILGYTVEWGLCTPSNGVPVPATVTDIPGAVTAASINVPTTGRYCFRIATRATGDTPGSVLVSVWSAVASQSWKAAPNPPTLFVVAYRTVYDLKTNADGTLALRITVGTTPIGTKCGDTVITTGARGNYYEVSKDDVVLDPAKTVKSEKLVAYCEPASA